ncbi:glycosyl hydrolase family 8 [Phyllobacterium endophyticum]|uniref:cellulase n=1 Tax=Phyllobacterium endophyticum TaxID=1149773 RepID=A0A2P7ANT6_9HYPH|nr:glycosyl hydrolase family 8 [Phyllobacterium endophyticum]MBB3233799.1 endoglucanase [Phyllobacterium endophyticum]PSH55866.1 endoglucanase [Phyllobacterium endophyticum]TYR41006.1 endoglucanase [Phyllobacterium endophyticum]
MKRYGLALTMLAILCSTTMAQNLKAGQVRPDDWQAYKSRFIDERGRVIDDANGNISHSEGQGYGLLLSYLANNKADFDLIWSFTRTEFLLRDDGLAVWKWDPNSKPHVTDSNNASDGDILIAYALALAGSGWNRNDLAATARTMVGAIGKANVIEQQGRLLLLPAVTGFSERDREDGPLVNLSYWIFEAFPKFASVDNTTDWTRLSKDGLSLIEAARGGQRSLPADWLSAKTTLRPAKGFKPEFGYNALRIPLYMMRAGIADAGQLRPLRQGMSPDGTGVAIVDIPSGSVTETLHDPGYLIIPALIDCVLDKKKLPASVTSFRPTLYYPSTLHLLSLSFIYSQHSECL